VNTSRSFRAFLLVLACAGSATRAAAQNVETVGTRALGMGGAFVAVANDSSATWWNPAGLAAGPFLDMAIARTGGQWSFALATPPFGVSYYRLRLTDMRPLDPTAAGGENREDRRAGVGVTQVGATVLHTLSTGVHAGATVKYVRGDGDGAGVGAEDVGVDPPLHHARGQPHALGGEIGEQRLGDHAAAHVAAPGTGVREVPGFVDLDAEPQAALVREPQEEVGAQRARRAAADHGDPCAVLELHPRPRQRHGRTRASARALYPDEQRDEVRVRRPDPAEEGRNEEDLDRWVGTDESGLGAQPAEHIQAGSPDGIAHRGQGQEESGLQRIAVRKGNEIEVIPISRIESIEAEEIPEVDSPLDEEG